MSAFVFYMIKATICLVGFALFFRLLLMRETFFRFTRFTLLAGMILCTVLPLFHFKTQNAYVIQKPIYYLEQLSLNEEIPSHSSRLIPLDVSQETPSQTSKPSSSWMRIVLIIYVLGVLVMLVRLLMSVLRVRQLIRSNKVVPYEKYKLVICRQNITAFSFFNRIVISQSDYDTFPNEIITHEKVHLQKKHNIDVWFSELFLIFHWFNPAIWMLRDDLREVHEYEADKAVLESGIDAQVYQLLLVRKAVGEKYFSSVVNNFNRSKIKNRIGMMLQQKSLPSARFKSLLIIVFFAVLLFGFTKPESEDLLRSPEMKDTPLVKEFVQFYQTIEHKNDYIAYLYLNDNHQLVLMDRDPNVATLRMMRLRDKGLLAYHLTALMTENRENGNDKPMGLLVSVSGNEKMKELDALKKVIIDSYNQVYPSTEVGTQAPLTLTFSER